MKVSRVLAGLGALAFAIAPLTAANATRAAHTAPATSYDISFDGYCDGLHLNLPSAGLPGDAKTVDGDQIGCLSGGVFGQARPSSVTGQYGVTQGAEFVTIPGYSMFAVINRNRTWVLYNHEGNTIGLVNSGTWSLGAPAPGKQGGSILHPAGRAGAQAAAAAAAAAKAIAPLRVDSATDISFDGYCDGMHLVSPSAGLGTVGTVDGNRTGCVSEGLIGAKTRIGNSKKLAYDVEFDNGSWIQASIFKNHTWVMYSISGSNIFLVNSGSWSYGTPSLKTGLATTTS